MNTHDAISWSFLALTPCLAALPLWRALRQPSEYSLWEKILYCPVYCLGRILWRVEVVGSHRSIASLVRQGAVIVANHRCSLDPFFLQIAAGRRIHWMVASEYFRNPIFGPVLRLFQAIPTNRSGSDSNAIKTAIRLASQGRLVGMFPEGRINRSPHPLQRIRSGAAMVAGKAQAPLLPCWIEGAPRGWDVWSALFLAAHVRVFVGSLQAIDGQASHDQSITLAMRSAAQLAGHNHLHITTARLAHLKTIAQ